MKFEDIDAYLHKVTPKRDETLKAMESYAKRNGFPIIGPLVGRFLYQAASMIKARRVLELGSGYGYSAYWFAQALGDKGKIVMTDGNESNRRRALQYIEKAGIKTKMQFIVGDAIAAAKGLKGPFDIVLNDIDKEDYPRTIEIAARLLRRGGLFITDNIIWSGRVYDAQDNSGSTRAIRKFTRALYKDKRFFTTIIPLRDGITVAMRR